MEMADLIDALLAIIVTVGGWWASNTSREQKRLEILLNKTREEYATKYELREDMNRVMDAIHRVEDKLDKVLSKD